MRRIIISMLLLIAALLFVGCGNDKDEDPEAAVLASTDTADDTSDTGGGEVSPSADSAVKDGAPQQAEAAAQTPVEGSNDAPNTNAAETPGNEEAPTEESPAQDDYQDEDEAAQDKTEETQESQQPDTASAEDDDELQAPESSMENPSEEVPNTQPDETAVQEQTPDVPLAPEAVIGMWKPVDINWQGNEEENAAAAMLSDSLCIFSADGAFRLILPNSFLEFLQDDSERDLLFSITNGTWEKSGVAPDGSAKYSLSIPALTSFGFGSLNLQVSNGFLVFDDYDQMRLARYE